MHPTRTRATFPPPVPEARRWAEGVNLPSGQPLINVSQAAPVEAPPEAMRAYMAEILQTQTQPHLYGAALGLPELRIELAKQWSVAYQGQIVPEQVGITAGCNQAFAAAVAALTDQGDHIVLPVPWYFNHKMWLDMAGVKTVGLETGADLLPDPAKAQTLITPRTRAIVLVTPNNPGGVEYPADLVMEFYLLARENGIKLIIDETYRNFDSRTSVPHDLFSDPDWPDTLIHLYSFSKTFRLTGHRVGAIIASRDTLSEVEKFQDTVAICPPQLGQYAALWGLQHLSQWVSGERDKILRRRNAIRDGFDQIGVLGWQMRGVGAYFAYLSHPFACDSSTFCQTLVPDHGILALPGTMFAPEGNQRGASDIRIAFANIDVDGIGELYNRLEKARG